MLSSASSSILRRTINHRCHRLATTSGIAIADLDSKIQMLSTTSSSARYYNHHLASITPTAVTIGTNAPPSTSVGFVGTLPPLPSSSSLHRRLFHQSCVPLASSSNDNNTSIHVTIEKTTSNNTTNDNQANTTTTATGSTCSQGISLDNDDDDDEDDFEEMFVTADPSLGQGNIREWGGPRRGGNLAEPTRFGDWERKGRCTDF